MAIEMLMREAQGLQEDALMAVVRFVRFLKAETQNNSSLTDQSSVKARKAGLYRNRIHISDDFDAPLDDFKEYM